MALVYASASGNFSSASLWLTGAGVAYGAVPTASDDVYANNKTITIDQDINVARLSNQASGSAAAGGGFNCSISANITAGTIIGSSQLLNLTSTGVTQSIISNLIQTATNATTAGTVEITGTTGIVNITCTNINLNGYFQAYAIRNAATSNVLNVTSNITAPTVNGGAAIQNSTGILNYTGTVTAAAGGLVSINQNGVNGVTNMYATYLGGLNTNGRGVQASTGTVNILTDVVPGPGSGYIIACTTGILNFGTPESPVTLQGSVVGSGSSAYISQNGNGLTNIYGNIIARSFAPSSIQAFIVNEAASGVINIRGNITGGTVANAMAVSNSSTGTIIVTGSVTGGTNATNTPAIYSTTAGTIDISGSATPGLFPAIFSTSQTAVNRVRGNLVYSGSLTPVYAYNLRIDPNNAQSITMQTTSGTNRILATSNISAGNPATTDVRNGVQYGSSLEFTGTLIVAHPSNIRKGVPTDNTTGSADLTAADMWNYLASNLTTSGSIGERMRNVATVDSVGGQIAAFTP